MQGGSSYWVNLNVCEYFHGGLYSSTSPTMPTNLPLLLCICIGAPGARPGVTSRMLNIAAWSESVFVISRQTASADPRMNTLNTARSDSAIALPPGFGLGFGLRLLVRLDAILDLGHRPGPEGAELRRPAVVDDL